MHCPIRAMSALKTLLFIRSGWFKTLSGLDESRLYIFLSQCIKHMHSLHWILTSRKVVYVNKFCPFIHENLQHFPSNPEKCFKSFSILAYLMFPPHLSLITLNFSKLLPWGRIKKGRQNVLSCWKCSVLTDHNVTKMCFPIHTISPSIE